MQKTKKIATAIAIFLIATFLVSMIALPQQSRAAIANREKTTYAFCGVLPNPVGVGQQVYVWFGITDYLENQSLGWSGLTVVVTKPDGSNQTLGPLKTAATGQAQVTFTPTVEGNYTFQTFFPAQWYNWTGTPMFDPEVYGNIYYKASSSEPVTLHVQQDPVPSYPYAGLPTEYWTRPINAQLESWYAIAGNWVSIPSNRMAVGNDYAPESSHILWTKPLNMGGLSGGSLGGVSSETGDAYEGKFSNTVVINGILYYNRYTAGLSGTENQQQGICAVDLKTGEEVWFRNNTRLAFGQTLFFKGFNMRGVFDYVYETKTILLSPNPYGPSMIQWNAYDALTGEYDFSISNVPSGTSIVGPNGEYIIYNLNLTAGWLAKWNSTTAVLGKFDVGAMGAGSWGSAANTQKTFNGNQGYDWNVTLDFGANALPGSTAAVLDDRIVGCTAGGWTNIGDKDIAIWAISTANNTEGHLLYNTTWTPPTGDMTVTAGAFSLADKVFTLQVKEQRQVYGFNLDTGKQIWGPSEKQESLQIYGVNTAIGYGRLICTGYGGVVYCYNVTTGKLLWNYTVADPYHQSLWNNWPMFIDFFAGEKVYLMHYEHSPQNPMPNGAPYLCLDMNNGSKVWQVPIHTTNWGGGGVIGDSTIAVWNSYDGQIYSFGKGKSATTVTGPDIGVPAGSSAIIRGTVTDQSIGAKDTPAISDESMDAWMQYLYMQLPRPSNATGVAVSLDSIDPNGNYVHIGDTTSDSSGAYSYRWVPPSDIPGKYTIIATFSGSNAYWASYAETSMSVDPAAQPTAAPTPIPATMADTILLPSVIAIIITIVAVGVVLALLVRKRP